MQSGLLSQEQINFINKKIEHIFSSEKMKNSSQQNKQFLETRSRAKEKHQKTRSTLIVNPRKKRGIITKLIQVTPPDAIAPVDSKKGTFNTDLGNYILLEEIGRGGMGIVFKARQKEVGRIVALKVMKQMDAMDPVQQARFKREITTVGKLNHPNIVAIYDAGKAGGTHYFAMEFIEGKTLSYIIENDGIALYTSVEIMEKVACAVHHAHKHQIIHRDLKPANIIIDMKGEPHITDFGLAKDISRVTKLTESGAAMGTPSYMSPEQIEGKSNKIGPATDIYALGVILYELLTGKTPFSGTSLSELYSKILNQDPIKPRKLVPSIPDDLETIVLKSLQKETHRRYPTSRAFANDLKHFRTGEKIRARPDSHFGKLLKLSRRHAVWLIPVLVLSFLSITFFWLWMSSSTTPIPVKEQYSNSQESDSQLKEIETLFNQNQFNLITQKLEPFLAICPDNSKILGMYDMLGKSYENTGKLDKAIETYQILHIYALQIQEQITALKGMMRCTLKKEQYKEAHRIFESVLEHFNIENDPEILWLGALALFHVGDFDKAQSFIEKAINIKTDLEGQKEYLIYKDWLKALTPVSYYPCPGVIGMRLVDITGKGQQNLVLVKTDSLIIQDISTDRPKTLYQIRCTENNVFSGSVVSADLTGDGEKEIIALARSLDPPGYTQLIVFKKKDNAFYSFYSSDIHSFVGCLWSGRLDKRDRDVVIVGVGSYLRDTKVLRYTQNGFETVEVDRNLARARTVTNVIDVGDIDGDGKSDLILGTSEWTFYDLRAYGYKRENTSFYLKATKRLGNVYGCSIADMDGDGRSEILATKSYTVNSEVFGVTSPWGEADGLYIFNYLPGRFEEVWKFTYPADKNSSRRFDNLCTGRIKNLQMAALIYKMSESIKTKTIEKSKHTQGIWLIRKHEGRYTYTPFTREQRIRGCAMGDLDGDQNDELVALEEDKLLIYGLESSKTSPIIHYEPKSPAKPICKLDDSIIFQRVIDFEKWGFEEEAEDRYKKLSDTSSIEEVRYQAFHKLVDILKRQRREAEKAMWQEKMLSAFPKEGHNLRQELLNYYRSSWQWQKAQVIAKEILENDKPAGNKEMLTSLLTWINMWSKREKIWEELFYEPPKWSLAHPTNYVVEPLKRELEATIVTGSWYHAGKSFYWKADSTVLTFDIQIKKIDWSGTVCFGIFSPTHKDSLLADFICDGGTGDLYYHVYFRTESQDAPKYQVGSYTTGVWYRIEIDYLKEIGEARLRLWARDGEIFIGEQFVKLQPLPSGVYMVGFSRTSKRNPDHPTVFAQVSIDNIEIKGGGWEEYQGKQEQELDFIYKYNSIAQISQSESLACYNSFLSRYPNSWRALEMRAYLWKELGKQNEFIADLRNLLLINPDHPNKIYFQEILKRFGN